MRDAEGGTTHDDDTGEGFERSEPLVLCAIDRVVKIVWMSSETAAPTGLTQVSPFCVVALRRRGDGSGRGNVVPERSRVQRLRRDVGLVGPDDRARFGVRPKLPEERRVA